MNLTFYYALERIPLGLAVTLEFTGPLAVSIYSSRQKIDFLWVLLAAFGIYFVMPHSEMAADVDFWGIIFALMAGVCWAFYILFGQKGGQSLHSGFATTVGMTVAAMIDLPVGLAVDGSKLMTSSILWGGLAIAMLSSVLPYSLEMIALKRLPAKTFGILMSAEPALASLVGLLLLHETLLPSQWLAIVFIVVASAGSALTARGSVIPQEI
jgi:inner membrane transporter RhtA